jgi:hypothetical protein
MVDGTTERGMLGLKIEVEETHLHRIITHIDGALESIKHFKESTLGGVLSEWQTKDMHRHRPFTMRAKRAGYAKTVIRQHSLLEMLRSEGAYLSEKSQRRLMRIARKHFLYPKKRRRYKSTYVEHRHTSTRKILRDELLSALANRLLEAGQAHIGFSSCGHPGRPARRTEAHRTTLHNEINGRMTCRRGMCRAWV